VNGFAAREFYVIAKVCPSVQVHHG